jgi:hypothetical protein
MAQQALTITANEYDGNEDEGVMSTGNIYAGWYGGVQTVGENAWFSFQPTANLAAGTTIDSAFFSAVCTVAATHDFVGLRVCTTIANAWNVSSLQPSTATYVSARTNPTSTTYAVSTDYFGSGQANEIDLATDIAALLPLTTTDWINIALLGTTSGGEVRFGGLEDVSAASLVINYTAGGGATNIPVTPSADAWSNLADSVAKFTTARLGVSLSDGLNV